MRKADARLQDSAAHLEPQMHHGSYYKDGYLTPERFAAYAYQMSEIMALQPRSVLEVGIGAGVTSYLLERADVSVTTVDIDPALSPDVVASVTALPLDDASFDLVACFQVLEHLPFDSFEPALRELCRIAREYAIISVPDFMSYVKFGIHLPRFGDFKWLINLPFIGHRDQVFTGEHYWTLNTRSHKTKRIAEAIRHAGFTIVKHHRPWEHPYHHFFIMAK